MSSKFVVKVESSMEQQENMRNSRKSLKVLQRASTDKENLVGRQLTGPTKSFVKSKSENDFNVTADIKRKKLANATDLPPSVPATSAAANLAITAADLQGGADAEQSEGYWRELAEKRRQAINATLLENQELHEINASLKEELDVSNQLLDESRNLVGILTEMLEEDEVSNRAATTSTGLADDSGFERGESSKSFLHASFAEEADEGMMRPVEEESDEDLTSAVEQEETH